MGYGLIAIEDRCATVLDMGVLKLGSKKDAYEKLQLIHATVRGLILKYSPDCFAIESPFFGKNVQSMLKLGRAQGVAIATAMNAGLPVTEYSPKKIKQSITGNGNADKEQIWKMLQRIVEMPDKPKFFDATDAIAVALCHHYATQSPIPPAVRKKANSWEAFVKANGERVRSRQTGVRKPGL